MTKTRKIVLLLFVIFVIALIVMPTQSTKKVDLVNTLAVPSAEHWFGTDNLGRDLFSLMAQGCLRTLEVVAVATVISLVVGVALGLLAGYYGGVLETVIQTIADMVLIVPPFIMALILTGIFGFSPFFAGVILGFAEIGGYTQQITILCREAKRENYILAEKILGISDLRIILRHILPNVKDALLTFMANRASGVVMSYAGLAYIGLGTDITNPDWGTMIYQYRLYIVSAPRLLLWPTIGIFVLAFFFHVIFETKTVGRKVSLYE